MKHIAGVAAAVMGLYGMLYAYPPEHGPFERGQEPEAVPLQKCQRLWEEQGEGGVPISYGYSDGENLRVVLRNLSGDEGWEIRLHDGSGKRIAVATNELCGSVIGTYAARLNQDDVPDIVVDISSGGCGLAAIGSTMTFFLSTPSVLSDTGKGTPPAETPCHRSEDLCYLGSACIGHDTSGYAVHNVYGYALGQEDFVRFAKNGARYFMGNTLIHSGNEPTKDGKPHNFWVYRLYRFDGGRLVPADTDHPMFPKWVWYTDAENHAETTQLTKEQKERLIR